MTENTDSDTKINEKIKKEIERINHMKKNQLVEQLKLRNLDTEYVELILPILKNTYKLNFFCVFFFSLIITNFILITM